MGSYQNCPQSGSLHSVHPASIQFGQVAVLNVSTRGELAIGWGFDGTGPCGFAHGNTDPIMSPIPWKGIANQTLGKNLDMQMSCNGPRPRTKLVRPGSPAYAKPCLMSCRVQTHHPWLGHRSPCFGAHDAPMHPDACVCPAGNAGNYGNRAG